MQAIHRTPLILVLALSASSCGADDDASRKTCLDYSVTADDALLGEHHALVLRVLDEEGHYGFAEAYRDLDLAQEIGLLNTDWTRGVSECFEPAAGAWLEDFVVTGSAWLKRDGLPEACRDPLAEACVPGPDDPRGTQQVLVRIGGHTDLNVQILE